MKKTNPEISKPTNFLKEREREWEKMKGMEPSQHWWRHEEHRRAPCPPNRLLWVATSPSFRWDKDTSYWNWSFDRKSDRFLTNPLQSRLVDAGESTQYRTIATHKPTLKPPPTSDKSTPKPPSTTHKPSLTPLPTTHKPWQKSPLAHPEPPSTTQITTKPSPTTQNFKSDSQKKTHEPRSEIRTCQCERVGKVGGICVWVELAFRSWTWEENWWWCWQWWSWWWVAPTTVEPMMGGAKERWFLWWLLHYLVGEYRKP